MTTPAIEIRGLKKTFRVGLSGLKVVHALRGVDLTVRPGEIYGFLGPNGAGKSTTIKILTNLVMPTEGTALVFGAPLDSPAARQRIGYLPESPTFYDYLTGFEFLVYYGALVGLGRAEAKVRSRELLARVGLSSAGNLPLRRYSKGMTQRVGIAQALLQDPDLVILDEPVSGLDPIGRREVRELMLDLKARGKTVFFSTHIIQDVELVCDRVGIIIGGKMVREVAVAELLGQGGAGTEVVLGNIGLREVQDLTDGWPVREVGSGISVQVPPKESVEGLLQRALAAQARVVSVQGQRRALEDLFIDEISAQTPDDGPRAEVRRA